jgi:hypothetical protein
MRGGVALFFAVSLHSRSLHKEDWMYKQRSRQLLEKVTLPGMQISRPHVNTHAMRHDGPTRHDSDACRRRSSMSYVDGL